MAEDGSPWERLKTTGLPALIVLLPSFLWLALNCAVLQACVLPLLLIGRRREYYLASRAVFSLLHRPLVYLFDYSGSKVYLHGTEADEVLTKIGNDQAIILSNHNGDLDWLVGLLILDAGGGIGCCKAIIKKSLLAVPFFGFVWWGVDFVCITRSWAAAAAALEVGYKNQHAYRECQVPYALTIFPEGTRLTPKKLVESQAFAKSRGLPVLNNLLCPRTKGVWSAVNGLRLDSIFDATVAPMKCADGEKANLLTLGQGKPCELHMHMERIIPSDVPRDEEALGQWLYKRWEAKEQRLESYSKDGRFGSDGDGAAASSSPSSGPPRELRVRPAAGHATVGAVVWWLFCMAAFARWCLAHGRIRLLTVCGAGFVLLVASLGLVLHMVHFKKDHGAGKESKAKSS